MRAVIAAGGTAGHINPALAIADEIMKNEPSSEVVFVGREDGMEKKLVEAAGYRLYPIEIHGFSRSLKPKEIAFNLFALGCALKAGPKAKKLFRDFKPDIVIGCGGYVSGPVVRAAAKCGIKTAIHEQNSFPGVTTKLLSGMVDLVMAANDDAVKRLGVPEKCTVVGNPVRREFFSADRERLRRAWGVGERVCLVSFGGSLGARTINNVAAEVMKRHVGSGGIKHIHATGRYAVESFPELLDELGVDRESDDLIIEEYIDNMPECLAAADLVISRSGAITISELAASGTASVLIPSPNVSENHQYYNALTLADAGAALVFEEKELDPGAVADEIIALCGDRERLRLMGVNARSAAVSNTSKRIYDSIKRLAEGRG